MKNSVEREKLLAEYHAAVLESMNFGVQLHDSAGKGMAAVLSADEAVAKAAARREAIEAELKRIDGIPDSAG